jgi:hypothetical protein
LKYTGCIITQTNIFIGQTRGVLTLRKVLSKNFHMIP